MNVYVAAGDFAKAEVIADRLEAAGHAIVSEWHRPLKMLVDAEPSDSMRAADILQQIRRSDVFVLLSSPGSESTSYLTEAGYAMRVNRILLILGEPENLLLKYPGYRSVPTVDALIATIAEVAPKPLSFEEMKSKKR